MSKQIDLNERFDIFENFLTSNKHILERGDKEWESSKIFFQLAIEHANNSPLTHEAGKFENDGKVDWNYLAKVNLSEDIYISCLKDTIALHDDSIEFIDFFGNDKIITYSSYNESIIKISYLKDFSTQKEIKIKEEISGIKIFDTHDLFFVFTKGGHLYSFDRNGELFNRKKIHKKSIVKIDFFDNNFLVTYSEDDTIKILDRESFEEQHIVKNCKAGSGGIVEYKDGFISYTNNQNISIKDKNYKKVSILKEHLKGILDLKILANGYFLSHSKDLSIKIWNDKFQCVSTYELEKSCTDIVIVKETIILNIENELIVLDINLNIVKKITLEQEYINDIKVLFEKYIIVYNNYAKSFIFSLEDFELVTTIDAHEDGITFLKQLDEHYFVSTGNSYADTMVVWNNDFEKVALLEGHNAGVNDLVYKNNILYSVSQDTTLKIWDLNTIAYANKKEKIRVEKSFVLKNNNIITLSDQEIILWDKTSALAIGNIKAGKSSFRELVFLEDGNFIAYYSEKNPVVYDYKSLEVLKIFELDDRDELYHIELLKNGDIVFVYYDYIKVYDTKNYSFKIQCDTNNYDIKIFHKENLVLPYNNSFKVLDTSTYKEIEIKEEQNQNDIVHLFVSNENTVVIYEDNSISLYDGDFNLITHSNQYEDADNADVKVLTNGDIILYNYEDIKVIDRNTLKCKKTIAYTYDYNNKTSDQFVLAYSEDKIQIYDSNRYELQLVLDNDRFEILEDAFVYFDGKNSIILDKNCTKIQELRGEFVLLPSNQIVLLKDKVFYILDKNNYAVIDQFAFDDKFKNYQFDESMQSTENIIFTNISDEKTLSALDTINKNEAKWYSNYSVKPLTVIGDNIMIDDGKCVDILKLVTHKNEKEKNVEK